MLTSALTLGFNWRGSRASRRARSLALGLAAGCLVSAAPAVAADLLPELPSIEPEKPLAAGGGWYLRGDVGVGLGLRGARNAIPLAYAAPGGVTPVDAAIARARIDHGWSAGGGVGYRIGPSLRVDVTATALSGVRLHGVGVDSAFAAGASQSVGYYSAGTRSNVALANVYWDILNWNGLTPYVGAGAGVAWNRVYRVGRFEQAQPLAPATEMLTARHGSHASAAFALYAGVAYEIAPGVSADLGYRYMRLGNANSGRAVCDDGFACVAATPLRVKTLESHEVTLGVRWELGAL